jgi:hypothetical protein
MAAGDPINSPNVQPGTTIVTVNSTTVITLSKPAIASGSTTQFIVSHGWQGIELDPNTTDVTVAGTRCNVQPNQMVTQDRTADPSTQVFGPSSGNYSTTFSTQANATAVVTPVNIGSSATMLNTTCHLCVQGHTGPFTVTLPSNSAVAVGVIYSIDDCSGNAGGNRIVVAPTAGSIDGVANYTITTNYGSWSGYYTGQGGFGKLPLTNSCRPAFGS